MYPTFSFQMRWGLVDVSILAFLFLTFASALTVVPTIDGQNNCRTITVKSGDDCASLVTECGISATDLDKYNSDANLCSTLVPGQLVCCSAGSLPNITSKDNANGTCTTYVVKPNDSCSSIATANGLTIDSITAFNKETTWGFNNCSLGLPVGIRICLSTGDPPLPAPMTGSICGPTGPGTVTPTNGTAFQDLNPCPLNACCDIWGQCGIDDDFCIPSRGDYGNLGTAPPGVNGCVASCGTDVTNNDAAPRTFMSIGYYQSSNFDRPCMQFPISAFSELKNTYTHLHWAFGTIGQDLSVSINDTYGQFQPFLELRGIKRIVSFGGWGASTDPATYDLLRQAISVDHRLNFTDAVVILARQYGLDGIDFDWEYPGVSDVPNIPPGRPDDGENYLRMLEVLRSKLPANVTLSIAAPASYWYLRAFPISDIAMVVDYIVFMTYDLHGQWDYGNQYSDRGCPAGNCLRSHVNMTETIYTLAMVTKAGVASNQIAVGVSSYGRSFQVTNSSCTGPMCTYTGPDSGATPGMCSGTRGIVANAEINAILGQGSARGVVAFFDSDSQSDILVYDSTQWVSYMSDDTKLARRDLYKSLNFAGTSDWAVDLQIFTDNNGCQPGTCDKPGVLHVAPDVYGVGNSTSAAVTCTPGCVLILPPYTLQEPTTIEFPPYVTSLEIAWTTALATKGDDGSTTTITTIARTVMNTTLTVPPLTTTAINFWNTVVPNASTTSITAITLVPSIVAPPFVITDNPGPLSVGISHSPVNRTITPAPWPWRLSVTSPSTTKESVPSTVSFTTGAPGPSCTANCGSSCQGLFCLLPSLCLDPPCLPRPCDDCDDFWDPEDPHHPPDRPDDDDDPDKPDEEDKPCQPDVVTEIGLCSNGNMPIFNPVTHEVHCDIDDEDAPDWTGSCQQAINEDLADAVAQAELSRECCSASKKLKMGIVDHLSSKEKRAPACPVPEERPRGGFTFTCDFNKWPNICANARSAISSRNKPNVLTYSKGGDLHPTRPWYERKYEAGGRPQTNFEGWGLIGCEVEEYPWGSGNPNRNPNNKIWDEQSVLRLIPRAENANHGTTLQAFYGSGKNVPPGSAYTVVFANGPTGTTDDDYYLGTDTSKNICAQPYGNAFLLVNDAIVNPGQRSYDPWWDNKLFAKTVDYKKDGNGRVTYSNIIQTVSAYCNYPSPGKKTYQNGKWIPHAKGRSLDRKDDARFWACDSFPGYSGPVGHPIRRRNLDAEQDAELLSVIDQPTNTSDTQGHVQPPSRPLDVVTSELQAPRFAHVDSRQAAGSFLDASAFLYLGCGTNDEDPCWYGVDGCSSDGGDDHDDDDEDGWIIPSAAPGSSSPPESTAVVPATPSSPSPPPSAPAPEPTVVVPPTPTPTPDVPSDQCVYTDDWLLFRWNIWVNEDDKWNKECGDGCLASIRGRCGHGVTDWGCERDGNGRAYYHFNMEIFCTEYDMTTALGACLGGRYIPCSD